MEIGIGGPGYLRGPGRWQMPELATWDVRKNHPRLAWRQRNPHIRRSLLRKYELWFDEIGHSPDHDVGQAGCLQRSLRLPRLVHGLIPPLRQLARKVVDELPRKKCDSRVASSVDTWRESLIVSAGKLCHVQQAAGADRGYTGGGSWPASVTEGRQRPHGQINIADLSGIYLSIHLLAKAGRQSHILWNHETKQSWVRTPLTRLGQVDLHCPAGARRGNNQQKPGHLHEHGGGACVTALVGIRPEFRIPAAIATGGQHHTRENHAGSSRSDSRFPHEFSPCSRVALLDVPGRVRAVVDDRLEQDRRTGRSGRAFARSHCISRGRMEPSPTA
jgi:hypothetical protein